MLPDVWWSLFLCFIALQCHISLWVRDQQRTFCPAGAKGQNPDFCFLSWIMFFTAHAWYYSFTVWRYLIVCCTAGRCVIWHKMFWRTNAASHLYQPYTDKHVSNTNTANYKHKPAQNEQLSTYTTTYQTGTKKNLTFAFYNSYKTANLTNQPEARYDEKLELLL